jgi:membrane fusion protein (multidrug efflux system)
MRAILCSVLLALPMLSACKQETPPTPPIPTVGVASPVQRDVEVERDFVGEIRAVNQAEIRSKVTGRILEVQFREGELVQAGQPLFSLDNDTLMGSVREAEAGVNNAQANFARASADVARYRLLVEKGTISGQQYDTAVAAEAQAKAGLNAAQATLANAQAMLKESAILSPYSGRIGRAQVNVGAMVSAGQTLLATVSTTEAVQVDFALSEQDYLALVRPALESRPAGAPRPHIPAKLLLSDGSLYQDGGEITFSDRALSPETGTFAIAATFPNPKEVLKPGMYGRVRLVVQRLPQAVLVPRKAVQQILDKSFVNIVTGDTMTRKLVKVGANIGDDTIVLDGISVADKIVVEGYHKAQPGGKVRTQPVNEALPASSPDNAG